MVEEIRFLKKNDEEVRIRRFLHARRVCFHGNVGPLHQLRCQEDLSRAHASNIRLRR